MDGLMSPQNLDNVILPADMAERNFKYTSTHVAGPGLGQHPNEIIYEGCDCATASCIPECTCIARYGANYDTTGRFIKGSSTVHSQPVLECNGSCKCGPECINRLVQNGPRFPLEVFTTAKKGYGLRSREWIPKDSFVCEYAGEVLTIDEARKRTHGLQPHDMNFILVVRECLADGKVITTPIDPTYIGNIGRFMNHSCQPNLYLITVRIDNDITRVAMFAKMDIDTGEELTYSYWGDYTPQSPMDDSQKGQRSPCFCGSANCQGFLPYNEDLYQLKQ